MARSARIRCFNTFNDMGWDCEVLCLLPINAAFHSDSSCLTTCKVLVCHPWHYALVMGRTPFYRTSIELGHHFSNIERTRTCSFIGDRTRTPYFWIRTNGYQTSNLIGPLLDLQNYSSNRMEHHFFEHWTNSNVFIFW